MKKLLLLFLSFLLFNPYLSFAAQKPNPVLDTDGEELRPGVKYYIVYALWPGGGGVNFGRSTGNESCPLAVVQERWNINRGHPVTFTPVNPEEGVVRFSTDLNIKFFNAATVCNDSNVWKVDFDEELGKYIIVTNGVEGNPGCETTHNWFNIEQLGLIVYKLVFCPTVCNTSKVICKDVGTFLDQDGTIRVDLSDVPFMVAFIKASSMKSENILNSISSNFRFK